ncbi:MAG: hypothetical protein LBS46_05115 [Dysgonamonadaceae bacterium]|jgi:hypothetical protein|nr:hypothetical protein [Dysgonamonadaceae bacterium]
MDISIFTEYFRAGERDFGDMENDNDIFNEFQQALQGMKGNLHVLEIPVPVEKQLEYFKYSEKVREYSESETVEEQIEMLNSDRVSYEEMKYAMTFLAISGDVKAYRALESYSKEPKNELLNDWIAMSLLQARITLDSELSDEKQVFISTGLGGERNKLRFYAFFKSEGLRPFSDYQRNLIEKEMPFHIRRYQGEVEEIQIEENYFSLVFLIDLQVDLRNMLLNAVDECNEYGNFIQTGFIVTNVKKFGEEDIRRELQKR